MEVQSSENTTERNATLINDYLNDFVNEYTIQNEINDIDSSTNLVSNAILGLLNQLNRNPR